jgi:hypothetical protein
MKKLELRKKLTMPKRPSVSTGVKAPKFATDLYADLRDRRLLPLVVVLVVAIAAIPFLLGGDDGSRSQASLPASPAVTGTPARASFAVVPADPGLRAYRERFGHRPSQDPFSQPASASGSEGAASEGAGSSSTAGAAGETIEGGSTGAETTTVEVPPPGGETEGGDTTTKVVVQKQVLGYEIDARAGFVGSVHAQQGIPPATRLPSRKNPVVVFVGLSKDKNHALFLMTSNVTAYYGKGQCAVDKQSCQLLELGPGKSATFAYGYGEARYKVFLQRIVPVVNTSEAATTTVTTTRDGGKDSANGGATASN